MGGYRNTPKIDKLKLDNAEHLIKMAEYYINKFCEEYSIKDITTISENRFKACLTYIYNHYFKLSLYTDKKRAPAIENVIDYTDIGQLNAILKSYLYLCNVCDKIPSPHGFSLYCGIEEATLCRWYNEYSNIDININNIDLYDSDDIDIYNSIINNNSTIDIYDNSTDFINSIKSIKDKDIYIKSLIAFRYKIVNILKSNKENALADRLASQTSGHIGIIAILNHQYGWNDTQAQNITINQPQITLADLPKLADIPTNKLDNN